MKLSRIRLKQIIERELSSLTENEVVTKEAEAYYIMTTANLKPIRLDNFDAALTTASSLESIGALISQGTSPEILDALTTNTIEESQTIKEESDGSTKADTQVIVLLGKLLSKLQDIDTSLDYLSSAMTGESPMTIALGQKQLGRFRAPPKKGE